MDVMQRIQAVLDAHPIVLFMKGTPQFPMCGFSSRAAQCLKNAGASFHAVNVLEDPEIRANLPQYANWKTFPQLYVHGELIGGSDIVADLEASGELKRIVDEAKVQEGTA
jgi:monothiol glutaredoxin